MRKKGFAVFVTLMLFAAAIMAQATKTPQPTKPAAPQAKPAQPATPQAKPAQPAAGKTDAAKTETVAVLQTSLGNIVIRFFPDKAPNHVKNFQNLCKSGFYNGTKFHRVIPNFMIQGGDPNSKQADTSTWGLGGNVDKEGKELNVKAEFNDTHHQRGIVSMARAQDPDSASSQFFICVADAGYLDHKYTAFGEVISGMDVVDQIVNAPRDPSNDRPNKPIAITKAYLEKRPVESKDAAAAPAATPAK